MSSGERIPLAEAQALADELVDLLAPSCHALAVAGSVRRERETIGDLELVARPVMRTTQAGLFGAGPRASDLWAAVDELVRMPGNGLQRHPDIVTAAGRPRSAPWGERYRKLLWLGRPVDLFTADGDSWGAQLLIRTGPPEYSQAWVEALRGVGLQMRGGWVRSLETDEIVPVPDEETAHALVGWPFVLPPGREAWRGSRDWSKRPLQEPGMSTDDTDTRPTAHRLTVTSATLRRAEALGFEPGSGDVLTWALDRAAGWQEDYLRACAVATALHNTSTERTDERDAARRDLARIVQLCGWDCDGNDPETPAGAIHLYTDAVQAVRELVEERNHEAALADALGGDERAEDASLPPELRERARALTRAPRGES